MKSETMGKNVLSLIQANEGEEYCVTNIAGGSGAHSRLMSLGILRGQNLKLMKRGESGPLMIFVKGTKIALGRGISSKIMVSKASAGSGK